MKVKKEWCLPRPPKKGEFEYHPVVRLGRHIPFGYHQDENDPNVLLPIPSQLDLFEKAKEHLKHFSYREVAGWLSKESGRRISHEGLRKRVNLEKRRQRDFANAKLYAERAEEAARKAEEIAKTLGGPSTRVFHDAGSGTE